MKKSWEQNSWCTTLTNKSLPSLPPGTSGTTGSSKKVVFHEKPKMDILKTAEEKKRQDFRR